jgi:hypothetical protein
MATRKTNGIRNRTKGNNYERQLAITFRKIGYDFCKTSRQASRLYDDTGIDLWGIPFLVQAKNGYVKSRIKPDVEFRKMEENLKKNFPPNSNEHNLPKFVFNKLNGYKKENHLVTTEYHTIIDMIIKLKVYDDVINDKKNIKNEIDQKIKEIYERL